MFKKRPKGGSRRTTGLEDVTLTEGEGEGEGGDKQKKTGHSGLVPNHLFSPEALGPRALALTLSPTPRP
jgi:hypothetical protein